MDGLYKKMPREGIGPPTPAFSGPRSTTELSRLMILCFRYILHKLYKNKSEKLLPLLFIGYDFNEDILCKLYIRKMILTGRNP